MTAYSPDEAKARHDETVPKVILDVVNTLLAERAYKSTITIKQNELVEKVVEQGIDRAEAFKRGWFDIEQLYRDKGWEVVYDRPAYNESYEAYWTFSPKAK